MLQDVVEVAPKIMQDNLVRADDFVAAAYCHVRIVTGIEQSLRGHKELLVSARYLSRRISPIPALFLCVEIMAPRGIDSSKWSMCRG